MNELPAHPLAIWESFYVIVGSSAAALTGLQFVVVAFVADRRARISARTLSAFTTPAIIHYSVVLFVSATLSAPWQRVTLVDPALVLVGGGGVLYTWRIYHKMRTQRDYVPVLDDWVWHVALPLLAYGTFFVAALLLWRSESLALFFVAGVSLMLLFVGIHAAWDTVTYIATKQDQKAQNQGAEGEKQKVTGA